MLYAWYGFDRKELLLDHIINGLKFIKYYYISLGFHKVVCKRLQLYFDQENIKPDDIKLAMYLTYVSHDLGKASIKYQCNILNGKGAPGHELLSALIIYDSLNKNKHLYFSNVHEEIKFAIILAIIKHHSAMRPPMESIAKFHQVPAKFKHDAISEIHSIIRKAENITLTELPIEVKPNYSLSERKKFYKEVLRYLNPVPRNEVERYKYQKITLLSSLLLHPLMTADNYAAAIASKKKQSEFRPFLREFMRTYDYVLLLRFPTKYTKKSFN